ncbi:MAG TPA: hypothetical protein VMS04_11040 [Vicinamibacterales bacterium]|jgi:hypothetical protein|nr:hypothetical protein [Vicinamibacterales bacterium]
MNKAIYAVTFPQDAPAGYGGTHRFDTRKERALFILRAGARGVAGGRLERLGRTNDLEEALRVVERALDKQMLEGLTAEEVVETRDVVRAALRVRS